MRGIPDIIHTLTQALPLWALIGLGLIVAGLLLPGWMYSVRQKQIKNRLRWLAGRRPDRDREAVLAELFSLAGEDPRLLTAVAEEALRVNQREVLKTAMQRLEATGKGGADLARLRREIQPERPTYKHPVEAAAAVTRLLDEGLTVQARARLTEAVARFPDDPELARLAGRLAETVEPA